MPQLPIQKVAFAGFGLAAVTVFALAAVTWDFTRQTLRAAAYVAYTQEVIGAVGNAQAQLFRAESSHRAYLGGLGQAQASERDAAVGQLLYEIDHLGALTADNETQQRRLAELRPLIERRIDEYGVLQLPRDTGDTPGSAGQQLMAEGAATRARLAPMFEGLAAAERALLAERQRDEDRRRSAAELTFIGLMTTLSLLLAMMAWRIRTDFTARRTAEALADEERRFNATHARALTLYNATNDRREALDGTLALLAETQLFPVSAFYAHHDVGGLLSLAASRAAPADTQAHLHIGEGLVGSSARQGTPVYLETFDAAAGLRIEAGLAALRPAAMLFVPVLHQGHLLGVLVLAAARRLAERERVFVDRLGAQLGVALHNLGQLEDLSQLAERLRESGEEIRQKNEQLEHGSRMKSEFLANMSHELRTPLNAVIGFSEILRDGLAGALNGEQIEYIGDIHDSGKHLLSLINDILDLSKVEAGQMALELASVSPAELSASGVAVVREKAALRRIQVSEAVPPGLGRLRVDPRRTRQIVYNLLSNAVKFTPDGGRVGLSVRQVDGSWVQALREADDTRVFPPADGSPARWLEIEVTDSGIGISPDGLRRLFQPFVQIDSSLSRKYAGTGLGLTMVRRLTELHGGAMAVRSTPGQGACFTVWLPWRDAAESDAVLSHTEPPPTPSLPPPTAAESQAPLVLVIEDDPRAASLIQLQLREHGYRIEIAHNAEAGLQRAAELQPSVIVLDIILPGMDGWGFLARLKENPLTQHVPVVIVSITDEPRRGFALGAAQVLLKPIAKEELLAALAAAGLQPYNGGGHVLVVDDDPKAVTLVCKHLESAGFTAQMAYGGQQALEIVASRLPDLMVLDLMMPSVSGFDVIEALARRPETAALPIVVLTAKLVSAVDREQLRGRVQRIIEKSEFQPALLLAEVQRAMAKQRAQGVHLTAATGAVSRASQQNPFP